ncbi:hypothetical protein K2173_012067 [Erythroxylum novogranatense]|uniref:RING-type domain-containing protein n=1 Tax=Erythroxylum novogranatense TaxID=1862640 RepID=A0AAV8TEX6_9ROSI|nr:hypothetical protein K2173_012067 [Erythroxylum novogranatense]
MEVGESSASCSSTSDIWAMLVPSDSRFPDVEIRSNEMLICSAVTASSFEKLEWCQIMRNSDQGSATLQNRSSNTIYIDEAAVHKEDEICVTNGSEIIFGPDREGFLSYRFKVIPHSESCVQQLKISVDVEHAKCSICLNLWHDVVTIAPCFHNFCNGCFSEWLRRSQEKHSNVLCPQCRAVVQFVGRNHFLHGIAEDILQSDPALKRPDEEIALLDSYASIRSNMVIQTGKKLSRKRTRPVPDYETEDVELPCPQCGTEFNGFRCNRNTIHLQCQSCGGMMPSRTNINVPQHCLGCDRAFCGAYWHAQRVTGSDSHLICNYDDFKKISERTISTMPFLVHEANRHEQEITERSITKMGRTLQDVISDWIVKLDNREIDRTRMPLNHAEMITGGTHVCNECFNKLVSFLLYWLRISMPRHLLPADAAKREDCWYGYACRTQHHNQEHARRRNHVCRPTRGVGTDTGAGAANF